MKRSELLLTAAAVPLDAAALFTAYVGAYALRDHLPLPSAGNLADLAGRLRYMPDQPVIPFGQYVHFAQYVIPAMLLAFALTGAYALRARAPFGKRLLDVLTGVTAGLGVVLVLFVLKRDFFLPRSILAFLWPLSITAVLSVRLLLARGVRTLNLRGVGSIDVALVGSGRLLDSVAAAVARRPEYAVRAVVPAGTPAEVLAALAGVPLDEVVVVNGRYGSDGLLALRNSLLERHVGFNFVPELLGELGGATAAVRQDLGVPMLEVRPTPLEGWGRVSKRAFDLVAGSFILALFSPLFIFVAGWIALTSPGPLLYRHRRIGRGGRPFTILKFRTMYRHYCTGKGYGGDVHFSRLLAARPDLRAEWDADHKLRNDPRISPAGRFLRATSLDELPQLFNVLAGSLSLVGPRPIVEEEVAKYGDRARILFTVKPGLTGLWQVSGRNDTGYAERIALDAEYIERWSLGRDLAILWRTARVLLRRNAGAY